jgi:hypothetical protein
MAVPGARRLAPRRQRGGVRRLEAARRRRAASKSTTRQPWTLSARRQLRCTSGVPEDTGERKMPSKGSRRVGPTEVPAMRYPHNHPPALANERNVDALPAMGEKKHRGNFTGCTRRPCLKRRRGSCPSSPARCRSSPRNVKFHQHRHLTRSTRPATYRELRPFRYAL